MFWLEESDKQALSNWRNHQRHIEQLKHDLTDLRDIFWSHSCPNTKAWAQQMIKSIKHELEQLER